MMRREILLGWFSLALLSIGSATEQMRVTSDGVNVRSGPGTRYEIVCQAEKDDLLTVRRTMGDWAEVLPPADAKLWVYGELIDGSTVAATRIQVRSGPGISYRPVGKLEKGVAVSIVETSGDWVRIIPPKEAAVWISSQYLESPDAKPTSVAVTAPPVPVIPAPAPSAKPRRPTPPKPVAAVAPESPRPVPPKPVREPAPDSAGTDSGEGVPAALVGRPLAKGKPQGELVEMSGEIRSSGFAWGKLSPYRLVAKDARGRTVTVCYVLGNSKQLASIKGRRVSIQGKRYWVRRVRYPGVRPDRIRVLP